MGILDELENTPERIRQRKLIESIKGLSAVGVSCQDVIATQVDHVLQEGVPRLQEISRKLPDLKLDLPVLQNQEKLIEQLFGKNFHEWLAVYASMVSDEALRAKVRTLAGGKDDPSSTTYREVLESPIGSNLDYAVAMEKNPTPLEQALNSLGEENKQKLLQLLKSYADARYIVGHGGERLKEFSSLWTDIRDMIEPALPILWQHLEEYYSTMIAAKK